MTTEKKINGSDIYLGYFAGVFLALLASSWLADVFVTQLTKLIPLENASMWRVNISSGLFFGISFANPFGILISKTPVKRSLKFLLAGFVFGIVMQVLFFTPLVGHGMSNFVRLLVVGSVVPFAIVYRQINGYFAARGVDLKLAFAKRVLAFTAWPDRLIFILLMSGSFGLFWHLTETTEQVLIALATVLTILTGAIALRRPEDDEMDEEIHPDFQEWLDMEPEEFPTVSLTESAWHEAMRVLRTMLPGAILFGGMIRLSVLILVRVYPNLQVNLQDPMQLWQTIGIVAASGLGLVLLGMLLSLGFSLMLLQLIGRVRNWTNTHLRENCFHLLRTLYFRPIKRG